jgi:flagellar biosynthesis GTPase FlhF
MKVKTFVFEDLKKGMERIKEQYGPDTIIVDIKNNGKNTLNGGCEISVALAPDDPGTDENDPVELRRRTEAIWNHTAKLLFEKIAYMESEITMDRMKSYPLPLRIFFEKMIKNGFDAQLAIAIISEVYSEIGDLAGDSIKATFFLKNAIVDKVKVTDITDSDEPILMLGPTGSGKTQTTKKIANMFSKINKPVSIIAYDPTRRGSYDDLMSFSENAGIPFSFTTNEEDLCFILGKDRRKKIIDISGHLIFQKSVVEKLKDVRRLILLPAGARDEKFRYYFNQFDDSRVVGLAFTKLDEEETLGHICRNAMSLDKPLCFLTTGINVDDIVMPDKDVFYKIILEGNPWKTEEKRLLQ